MRFRIKSGMTILRNKDNQLHFNLSFHALYFFLTENLIFLRRNRHTFYNVVNMSVPIAINSLTLIFIINILSIVTKGGCMKKILLVMLLLTILAIGCTTNTQTLQIKPNRRVVMELFSANWCPNCPHAEYALQKMVTGDSVIGIVYHPTTNDTFGTEETDERFSYYGLTTSQTPEMVIDGKIKIMGAADTTIYDTYENAFLREDSTHVPVEIGIDTLSVRDSTIYAGISIKNTDTIDVKYEMRSLLIENDIRYTAQNGETLHEYVARKFFPDEKGVSITIPAGGEKDTIIRGSSNMLHEGMQGGFIVLLQNDSSKEVVQGAMKDFSIATGDSSNPTTDTTFLSVDAPLNDTVAVNSGDSIRFIVNNIKDTNIFDMEMTCNLSRDVNDWIICSFGTCLNGTPGIHTLGPVVDTIGMHLKDTVNMHIDFGSTGEGTFVFKVKNHSDSLYADSILINRVAE